ncbi:MAG: hypothetical protein ACI37U_09510 [Bacteroides sp.]
MKGCRWILLGLMALLFASPMVAQELQVTGMKLLEADNEAMEKPHYDSNNQIVALLKVYADNVTDLTFASGYIIKSVPIEYKNGYYAVYIASGVKYMEIRHADYQAVQIDFKKEYQLSIRGGKTYRIDVKAVGMVKKHTQTVVFNMLPQQGMITVDGQRYMLSEGMLQIECNPGNHTYTAESDYHQAKSGTFSVSDIEEPQVIPIKLNPQTTEVLFSCNAPDAVLYVDQVEKGGVGVKTLLMGTHKIRVVAEDWKDYTSTLLIEQGTKLDITMMAKSFVPIVVRVTGADKASLYVDNKQVPNWKNGQPFKVKQGKHLITVESETSKTKEKVVNVRAGMSPIEFSF